MKVELFITRRLAFSSGKSFSRFVVRIAIAAVALSLAVMITSISMVNGFQKEISGKIYGFWGHVYITKFGFGRSYEDNTSITAEQVNLALLKKMPNVDRVEAFAYKPCIIKTSDQIEGTVLKGLERTYKWDFFKSHMVSGVPITYNDSSFSRDIMISKITANRLKLKVGDDLELHFVQRTSLPLVRRMKVCGIYNTGMEEYDALYALADMRMIQDLNKWMPDEVTGYEVFLKKHERNDLLLFMRDNLDATIDEDAADPIAAASNDINFKILGPELSSQTVMEVNPNIFDWLGLQNTNKWVILGLMVIVALVNMITCLLILILERTNMIGILKALGAQNWSIRMIFVYNALYIIILGLLIGNTLGIGICLLQKYFKFIKLPEESYYVSTAPIDLNWWTVLGLNAGTLFLCFLVLLIPSWLVSRITPVKAIRFR